MFVTTHSLEHHRIVFGTYNKFETGKMIDEVPPKFEHQKSAYAIRKC